MLKFQLPFSSSIYQISNTNGSIPLSIHDHISTHIFKH